jgi:hypothetical protein
VQACESHGHFVVSLSLLGGDQLGFEFPDASPRVVDLVPEVRLLDVPSCVGGGEVLAHLYQFGSHVCQFGADVLSAAVARFKELFEIAYAHDLVVDGRL